MNERNVLVLAYYFPPMGISGVLRTVKFVKYLCDYGWNPTVLAGTPRAYYSYDDTLLNDFGGRPVDIVRTSPKKSPKTEPDIKQMPGVLRRKTKAFTSLMYQPDTTIRWKKNAMRAAAQIIRERKIHCIFATAPPFSDFLIAKEIAETHKIPFVIDYRESWAENQQHSYPTILHRSYNKELESGVLKTASKVIVSHRLAKERLLIRYRFMRHEDICIIPSGYDTEDFLPFIAFRPEPEKLTITHCGMFEHGSSPRYFLRALAKLLKKKPEVERFIEARFIGTLRPNDLKSVKKLGLEKMVWATGYVPHQEAVGLMAESDVLWYTSDSEIDVPGKVFEYFGAKRPILCLAPENAASRRVAGETKACFGAKPDSVKEILKELERIVELWQNGVMPAVNETALRALNYFDLAADLSREIAIAAKL